MSVRPRRRQLVVDGRGSPSCLVRARRARSASVPLAHLVLHQQLRLLSAACRGRFDAPPVGYTPLSAPGRCHRPTLPLTAVTPSSLPNSLLPFPVSSALPAASSRHLPCLASSLPLRIIWSAIRRHFAFIRRKKQLHVQQIFQLEIGL